MPSFPMSMLNSLDVEALIEAVARSPAIWDKSNKLHGNRFAVDNCWRLISEELNYDEMACRKKWKYLRDNFSVEWTKLLSMTPGQAPMAYDDISYFPKWQYFSQLLFLKDIIKPRPTPTYQSSSQPYPLRSNLDTVASSSNDTIVGEDSDNNQNDSGSSVNNNINGINSINSQHHSQAMNGLNLKVKRSSSRKHSSGTSSHSSHVYKSPSFSNQDDNNSNDSSNEMSNRNNAGGFSNYGANFNLQDWLDPSQINSWLKLATQTESKSKGKRKRRDEEEEDEEEREEKFETNGHIGYETGNSSSQPGRNKYYSQQSNCHDKKPSTSNQAAQSEGMGDNGNLLFLKSLLPHMNHIPKHKMLRFRRRMEALVEDFAYPDGKMPVMEKDSDDNLPCHMYMCPSPHNSISYSSHSQKSLTESQIDQNDSPS